MTIKVDDLFGACPCDATLGGMIEQGYVRSQVHPTLPLVIYNYSEKCAYERMWNPVTLQCRGLIVNYTNGEVVARPFRKFFNYGETSAPALDLNQPAIVTDKMDGSLGIVYPTPDGPAVATRGSFTSEQALHATELLRSRYPNWAPQPGFTVLFEIIYPANRIVLDYQGLDDLVQIGAVHIDTGKSYPPAGVWWPGPLAQVFQYASLRTALAAKPRPNAEGLVVHLYQADERIKLKQDDYVALHRIVTGLNARTVWEHMMASKTMESLIAPLPDEFHEWVWDIALGIYDSCCRELARLTRVYKEIFTSMPLATWDPKTREGRAQFASIAATHPDKWALFALLDGRDIYPELLKRAKPEPFLTPSGRVYTEETA